MAKVRISRPHDLLMLLSGEIGGGLGGGGLPRHARRQTLCKINPSTIATVVAAAAAVPAVTIGWHWAVAGWRDWAKESR